MENVTTSECCLLALKPERVVSQIIEFGGIAAISLMPIFAFVAVILCS
jgi:hypothetical protein